MNVSDGRGGSALGSGNSGGFVALFFDQDWFQARLAEVGQTHDALAGAAGLTVAELAAVWKDQMEITSEMVEGFAAVLGTDLHETASRCGISSVATDAVTPEPVETQNLEDTGAMLKQVISRLDGIDQSLAALHEIIAGNQGTGQTPDK